MTLAATAAQMHQTARTELELREKAGHAEDDPELHHRFQVFIADAQDFAEKVRAIEASPELTPVGMAARIKTLAERHVLTGETLDREAEKLERRERIGADEAWAREIALPQGNNLLAALQITETRRELAAMSDIQQDLALRDPGPSGHLARQAAYGLPGVRLTPWGLPGTEKAAREGSSKGRTSTSRGSRPSNSAVSRRGTGSWSACAKRRTCSGGTAHDARRARRPPRGPHRAVVAAAPVARSQSRRDSRSGRNGRVRVAHEWARERR
jgi:hypothetical protein